MKMQDLKSLSNLVYFWSGWHYTEFVITDYIIYTKVITPDKNNSICYHFPNNMAH